MKLSDIPIPGAPGLGSLEDIATALRNFLNGYHRPREEYFSDFINLLYEPTNLEDLYPLDFIMKRTINEENLDLACSIIRKNSWAVRQTWDNQFIFSKGFMKLADIPIFIPTIYPGIVSAVFLLFLLFPDKKTGIHFYSGLEKKSAKEIILHGPTVDANTLKEMYVGMRAAHKNSSYLAKIEQHLNLSFANFPQPSFRKKDVSAEEEAPPMRSILEAYDYVSHMNNYRLHKRHLDSKPPLFNDEMRETVFKTILLILAYQNNALTASGYYAKLHNFIAMTYQFHLAHESCIMLSKTAVVSFSHASRGDILSLGNGIYFIKTISTVLEDFLQKNQKLLHPTGVIYRNAPPLIIEQGLLFFTILLDLERNFADRKKAFDWQIWHFLDDLEQVIVKDNKYYDLLRRIFLHSLRDNATDKSDVTNPINVNNWNDFYKKYRIETDIICSDFGNKKEEIWNRSITALLFIIRSDLNAPRHKIVYKNKQRYAIPPSDVSTKTKLDNWRLNYSEVIENIPLSWVWSMMLLYMASDQVYVHINGQNTKFFSIIDSDQQASFDADKGKKYTLKFYIDNIYRHSYDEIEDLTRVLGRLVEISPQRMIFPFLFKSKWCAFIQQINEALSLYMNADAYHYTGNQSYQNMNNHFEESKMLLTRIYALINEWLRAIYKEEPSKQNQENVKRYLMYSSKLAKLN